MRQDEILKDYDRFSASLALLGEQVRGGIAGLVQERDLKVHALVHRVKPRESLKYKISRPDKTYESLLDLTDIIGIRVTTYFEDTVDAVAKLIESSQRVDFAHSIDKRRLLGHDTFGYRSVHYVCHCEPAHLTSDLAPSPVRFEVQIRTILQHAWAEIEHDLGYKSREVVPEPIRRRFSRLASLLEVADDEFRAVRSSLESYEAEVKGLLRDARSPVTLDGVSLDTLVREPEVEAFDRTICTLLCRPMSDDLFFPDYLLKMLRLAGIRTVDDARAGLLNDRTRTLALIPPYFEFARSAFRLTASSLEQVMRGYGLFFFAHLRILTGPSLELDKVARMAQFYQALDYPEDPRTATRVASRLVEALRRSADGLLEGA
jgi:ppGpp synthetase/RelA/SpoT-type nucleotidyltranferase